MTKMQNKRDKQISRQTSRLYIKAMMVRPQIFALCFLSFPITVISSILSPYLISLIIEKLAARQFESAEKLIWELGLILLGNIALKSFWNKCFNIDGTQGAIYLYKQAYKRLINQDYDFFADQYTGSLASHVQRFIHGYIDYNNLFFETIPRTITIVFGSITVLMFKSPVLGLITLACVIMISFITSMAAFLRLGQRRRLSEETGKLAGQLSDSLGHAVTVKSFAKEETETTRLYSYISSWAKSQSIIWDSYILADVARTFMHAVMFVVILLVSLKLFKSGQIGLATVALVQLYTIRLLDSTIEIAQIIKRNETDMSDAYQLMQIYSLKPKVKDSVKPYQIPRHTKKYHVTLTDVTFSYSGKDKDNVICDLKLDVRPGEKIGIVGPSGAGKSTITKLLLRFHDVTGGHIKINDIDIRDLSQKDLRHLVGYVPQEPLLFHRSIYENIAYAGVNPTSKEVIKAADLAAVTEFSQKLAQGLHTPVGERGIKLSGGQRQRVAIARAVLKDAPILVLDEATSALDSETESLIQKALWILMKDKTAIVIAHRLSTIAKMDRIAVVNQGKLIEIGSHKELLKKEGVYAKLWKHQSGGFIGDL